MKTIGVYSIKGGVGKTTTAVNLAAEAASRGWSVLLWDLDPQGGATYVFRTDAKVRGGAKALVRGKRSIDEVICGTDVANLDLVPADFRNRRFDVLLAELQQPAERLESLVAPAEHEYDWVILDCAPGASLIGENIITAADALLVPIIPAALSVRTLDQLEEFIDRSEADAPELFGFLSMVDRRRKIHRDLADSLPVTRDDVVDVAVPYSSSVERMGDRRQPIREFARTSRAAQAYASLWDHFESRWPEP